MNKPVLSTEGIQYTRETQQYESECADVFRRINDGEQFSMFSSSLILSERVDTWYFHVMLLDGSLLPFRLFRQGMWDAFLVYNWGYSEETGDPGWDINFQELETAMLQQFFPGQYLGFVHDLVLVD